MKCFRVKANAHAKYDKRSTSPDQTRHQIRVIIEDGDIWLEYYASSKSTDHAVNIIIRSLSLPKL